MTTNTPNQESHINPNMRDIFERGPRRPSRLKRVGAIAALAATAGLGVAGIVKEVGAYEKSQQAKFERTQAKIAPIIEKSMIKIDKQTLAEVKAHPGAITEFSADHGKVSRFINETANAEVIMGRTDGKADPNKPIYINYRNNTGTEHTMGINVIMNSPDGNKWVDKDGSSYMGKTKGGWGAAVPGNVDTTSRGPMNGGDSPVEAANEVAQTADEFGPWQPYS